MKIQVLLSAYNGCRFIERQIQSIAEQELPEDATLEVLVRNDGSTDSILVLLDELAARWKAYSHFSLKIYSGRRIGIIASFFDLLLKADPEACYIFFCDQDDIWLPTKVQRAVGALEKHVGVPALYFSRLQYVNNELQRIGQSRVPQRISFESALVENVATGCSMAFNQALRQMALSARHFPPGGGCLMHDWWMYLLALATGETIYDPISSIWYRQHGENAVGASENLFTIYRTKWHRFRERGARAPCVTDQAQVFLESYKEKLSPIHKKAIEKLLDSRASFVKRLIYAFQLPTRRQVFLDNLIFRVLIILGRY